MNNSVIKTLLDCELERQNSGIELIASENYPSKDILEACGSIAMDKYAEGYPDKRYYGGCEFIDKVEEYAIRHATQLFNVKHANVQPHSGSQANAAAYHALMPNGGSVLSMCLNDGAHLTHGSDVSFSSKTYKFHFFPLGNDGKIDYDLVQEYALKFRPDVILTGYSAYPFKIDFKKFREIADSVGALLMADVAHVAGLVVAGEYANPFPYADVVTTTTHKTLRGPRGGLILTNNEEFAKKIDKSVFPGMQGGPLMHVIAGKAVGFGENLKPEWKEYAKQVKANAQVLAKVLMQRGYKIVSDGTDNHLVLLSLLDKEFSGKDADLALGNAGITVNKNTVPGETRSPFVTSGVRIGSQALTARGFKEVEFEIVANRIADVLDDIQNTQKQEKIKSELKELALKFRIYDKAIF